jgi:hypothetical protein
VLPAEAVSAAIERLKVQGMAAYDIGSVVEHVGEDGRVNIA